MNAFALAALGLQVVAIVGLAPLVQGAMKSLRAQLVGRPGPSPVQPYRDLIKLWGKEALLPEGVSSITLAAPGIVLGVALAFVTLLPLGPRNGLDSLAGAVALVLLLALGRFVLILAALDTRSSFSGMAASREATFGALAEPALLISLLGAAAVSGGTRLSALGALPFTPASVLAFAAFFLISLAETARVPIDNQETHYELTMVHEGLSLEYSGWQLALVQGAAYIKQFGFLLLGGLLLPGSAWWAHAGWALVMACGITLVENALAKLRLFEVPQVLGTAFILAATSIGLRLLGGMP
jgi:formate hydrogenlyase subunit 4